MELKLNDAEMRQVLADALSKKVEHSIGEIDPEECWFEAEAGSTEEEIEDIHNVKFCFNTDT